MKTYISELNTRSIGTNVMLAGWVHATRRMGKIIFIDLRDSTGFVQVVCSPQEMPVASFSHAKEARPECVVQVSGTIEKRSSSQVNVDLPTGSIEIHAKDLSILSKAKTPPFEIVTEERQANEELRLTYRYLDLRHERMARNMKVRHRMIQFMRNYLSDRGFIEIQTPLLSKSTPEGARDYLVPSRLHRGKFFALPQSPQQYKQLLMVAGFERYFQIAPCFRDEDARADRSPGDFYQLDLEMSFVSQDDILKLTEELFTSLVRTLFPEKKITTMPWPRIRHAEAMDRYKTDKPDLRKNTKDNNELSFAWIIDFPLLVKQTKEDFFYGAGDVWAPSHHMFTAPRSEDIPLLDTDPGKVRSLQHDLVLNGYEVGGGSIRIHNPHIQEKIFDLIGLTKAKKEKFKHLLQAFEYGVPPHGGIAPGIDRLLMVLLGEKNLREVIAFPLTTDGQDPLMGSPSDVDQQQLDDLGISITT